MTVRWTFGVEPLPQTTAAAELLRRVTGLLVSVEHDDPAVDRLVAMLEEAEQALAAIAPADPHPRVGARVASDGRVYLDHSRDIGSYNPCFPGYTIAVDGDRASGTVNFPTAYEGPPGIVHGGFLSLLFDCVVQHHNCDLGVAGKTTSLSVRFRRPTPLLTELGFTVARSVDGDRITSSAQLRHADTLLAEAEVRALAGDRANLPEVSTRRPRR
jgi:acyl-coenzyme A thioesterase PaaI-like protein